MLPELIEECRRRGLTYELNTETNEFEIVGGISEDDDDKDSES